MSNSTYNELIGILNSVRKKQKQFSLIKGTSRLLFAFFGSSVVLFLLDNLLHFSTVFRWISFFVILVPSCYFAVKDLVLPGMLRHSDEWFARKMEKEYPGLDNAVINAVLLGREENKKGLIEALVSESLERVRSFDLSKVINWKNVKKTGLLAAVFAVAFIIYAAFFPSYFSNAFLRVFAPSAQISFISKTQVVVEPGDARVLRGRDLGVRAVLSGEMPEGSALKYKEPGKAWKTIQMSDNADKTFSCTISAMEKPVKYFVKAGDGVSPMFRADIVNPPAIETFEFLCRFPAYTRLPVKRIIQKTGDVEALFGSTISVSGISNNLLQAAKLVVGKKEYVLSFSNKSVKGPEFPVKNDFGYSLWLEDRDGYSNSGNQMGSVRSVSDKPPQIQVVLPGQNIIIGMAQRVPVLINVRDDYGLKTACIKFKTGEEKERVLKAFEYGGTAHAGTLQTWISPESMKLKADDVITYWIEAEDANNLTGPGKSVSTFLTIRLVDPFKKLQESMRRLASGENLTPEQLKGVFSDLTAALKEVLRLQKEIRKSTTDKVPASEIRKLGTREESLRMKTLECRDNFELLARRARDYLDIARECSRFASQMDELQITGLMSEAVKLLEDNIVYVAMSKEDEIIEKLTLIINRMAELNRSWMSKNFASREKAAKEAIAMLDRFMGSQKDVVSVLERISKKPAEDFSPEDLKDLKKLGDVEEAVRKDLSKGTNDFKNALEKDLGASVVVNTLEELIMFVKRAEGEFKKITITLDEKEMWKYIELAKQLREDLQMWLMNKPDTIQWNVANPLEDYDVPMPDIPLDLQDYISDLIQTEQEMDDALDNNMTGGWIDNMSTAGWAIMDGPISNWSAKGKTGNMLPGNQELTGRSGEGRTGKSSGQFVEGKYKGLEGRKIPPRLSSEKMQKGVVKEEKHKPTGGSTGGGKIAGWGAEGLTDNVPPQIKEQLKRLALREAEIRAQATEVKDSLNPYLAAASNLRQSINLMESIEKDLKEGRYKNILDKQRLLNEQIGELKASVEEEVELRREPALRMDRNIRSKIVDALKEKYPDKYEELVKQYFEALSRETK